jgi:hypothetical protein
MARLDITYSEVDVRRALTLSRREGSAFEPDPWCLSATDVTWVDSTQPRGEQIDTRFSRTCVPASEHECPNLLVTTTLNKRVGFYEFDSLD